MGNLAKGLLLETLLILQLDSLIEVFMRQLKPVVHQNLCFNQPVVSSEDHAEEYTQPTYLW